MAIGLAGLSAPLSQVYVNFLRFQVEQKFQEQSARTAADQAFEQWKRQHDYLRSQQEADRERAAADPVARAMEAAGLGKTFGVPVTINPDVLAEIEKRTGAGAFFPRETIDIPAPPSALPAPGQGAGVTPAMIGQERIRPLTIGGPQRVQTLSEAVPEMYGPGRPGARFGGQPAPMKNGVLDTDAIALTMQRHGLITTPAEARAETQAKQAKSDAAYKKSYDDLVAKMGRYVEGKDVAGAQRVAQAIDALNAAHPTGLSGIDVYRQVRDQLAQRGLDIKLKQAQIARAQRGEGVPTGQGTGRYRIVKGTRGGQQVLDTQTGVRLSIAQAQARAKAEGDQELARLLGVRMATVPEAVPGSLPDTVDAAEQSIAQLQADLKLATDPRKYAQIASRIEALNARIMAIKQRQRYGGGTRVRPQTTEQRPAAGPVATADVQQKVTALARRGISWEQVAAALRQDGLNPDLYRAAFTAAGGK